MVIEILISGMMYVGEPRVSQASECLSVNVASLNTLYSPHELAQMDANLELDFLGLISQLYAVDYQMGIYQQILLTSNMAVLIPANIYSFGQAPISIYTFDEDGIIADQWFITAEFPFARDRGRSLRYRGAYTLDEDSITLVAVHGNERRLVELRVNLFDGKYIDAGNNLEMIEDLESDQTQQVVSFNSCQRVHNTQMAIEKFSLGQDDS